jgi:hypothetical protein
LFVGFAVLFGAGELGDADAIRALFVVMDRSGRYAAAGASRPTFLRDEHAQSWPKLEAVRALLAPHTAAAAAAAAPTGKALAAVSASPKEAERPASSKSDRGGGGGARSASAAGKRGAGPADLSRCDWRDLVGGSPAEGSPEKSKRLSVASGDRGGDKGGERGGERAKAERHGEENGAAGEAIGSSLEAMQASHANPSPAWAAWRARAAGGALGRLRPRGVAVPSSPRCAARERGIPSLPFGVPATMPGAIRSSRIRASLLGGSPGGRPRSGGSSSRSSRRTMSAARPSVRCPVKARPPVGPQWPQCTCGRE